MLLLVVMPTSMMCGSIHALPSRNFVHNSSPPQGQPAFDNFLKTHHIPSLAMDAVAVFRAVTQQDPTNVLASLILVPSVLCCQHGMNHAITVTVKIKLNCFMTISVCRLF
jgi:hypothetical protein